MFEKDGIGQTLSSLKPLSCFVNDHTQMSFISVPLLLNDEYLLVTDYSKHNVYQLQLNSGEVRALPTSEFWPVALAFDPSIKGIYVTCDETKVYRIHKMTLDGKLDEVIYTASQSTFTDTVLCPFCRNFYNLNNIILQYDDIFICHYFVHVWSLLPPPFCS